jgi:hypothetical protein
MNALKAVSKTDDQLIVENHIVLFGGRDLEGKVNERVNPDGTRGEYFTKSTDLRSAYTNTGVLYVDWEHGQGGKAEPQEDDIIGFVDWTTAKADDDGIMVRRILDRRSRFIQMIEPLIEEGMIGTSSEAVPQGVTKADTGEITRWPLRRDTLTVSPMEPRMLSANALAAAKALGDRWPALKSTILRGTIEGAPDNTPVQSTGQYITEEQLRNAAQPTNQTAFAVENIEQPEQDDVAQDDAPAAKPEKAPEPGITEIEAALQQFLNVISDLLLKG